MGKKLSVVVPTFNEAGNVAELAASGRRGIEGGRL